MALGQLYERFLAQNDALMAQAGADYLAATNQDLRTWYMPDANTWDGDLFDIPGMALPWWRAEIASAYMDFFSSPYGTVGDCVAAKIQSDYLAAQERAFRLRHATPVRCMAHAANRSRGHAVAGAGVFGRVADYIQDALIAGATGVPDGGYQATTVSQSPGEISQVAVGG